VNRLSGKPTNLANLACNDAQAASQRPINFTVSSKRIQ
jgi:hypothetical protein